MVNKDTILMSPNTCTLAGCLSNGFSSHLFFFSKGFATCESSLVITTEFFGGPDDVLYARNTYYRFGRALLKIHITDFVKQSILA